VSVYKVDVLLATYNGQDFIAEQIDSVLSQQGVCVRIFVRDDGSTDATLNIIDEYRARYPDSVFLVEDDVAHCGAMHNFFYLMREISSADYFSFCDQDDVWFSDKLRIAVAGLEAAGSGPRLYCSAVDYVDSSLHLIGNSSRPTYPAFNNALAENIAQGCTMVFDASLRKLIVERIPEGATIHDWWTYLVASAFGTVIYDPEPRLQYRQHGGNVVGGGFSFWQKWQKRYRRFISGNAWKMAAQAEELLRLYPDMLTPAQKDLIHYFVAGKKSYLARLRFLFGRRVWRQSSYETLVIKFLVLINAY